MTPWQEVGPAGPVRARHSCFFQLTKKERFLKNTPCHSLECDIIRASKETTKHHYTEKIKMTKLDVINRAKSYLLLQMTRFLYTDNVKDAIASFVSDFQNYSPERDLDEISKEIDSLIDRLQAFKNAVKEEQQAILNADDDDIHDFNK